MKIPVGSKVKIIKGIDDTFDETFLNLEGVVVGHNDNEQTGNTSDDPLHDVVFDLNTVDKDHPQYDKNANMITSFWFEEMEII